MRIFELLLLASNIGWLSVMLFWKKERRGAAAFAVSGIALTLLILHLSAEGYRLQLLFLYGMTIGALAVSGYLHVGKGRRKKFPRFAAVFAYASAALVLLATAVLLYAFPVFTMQQTTDEYRVGTQAFRFVDTRRQETFGEKPGGPRELMVQVWYPAQERSGGRPAPFVNPRLLRHMAANYGLPESAFRHLRYVSSQSYAKVQVSSAKPAYPLILGNPGFGSSRFLHTAQAQELASHGYIVAVIDHTYNTFATEFPDGRITTDATASLFTPDQDYAASTAARDRLGTVLTDDVTFVLDSFEQLQSGQTPSLLEGKIDLGHIGTFGHSIGGATAYDAAFDPRIDAGADLDGGLYRLRERGILSKPFLFMNSASEFDRLRRIMDDQPYTDAELEEMHSTKEREEQVSADKKLELARMREAVKQGGQAIYIDDAEHLNFTDAQFFSPAFQWLGIAGSISPDRANAVTNAYLLDFFDKQLKNRSGRLIQAPDARFPEAKFFFRQDFLL